MDTVMMSESSVVVPLVGTTVIHAASSVMLQARSAPPQFLSSKGPTCRRTDDQVAEVAVRRLRDGTELGRHRSDYADGSPGPRHRDVGALGVAQDHVRKVYGAGLSLRSNGLEAKLRQVARPRGSSESRDVLHDAHGAGGGLIPEVHRYGHAPDVSRPHLRQREHGRIEHNVVGSRVEGGDLGDVDTRQERAALTDLGRSVDSERRRLVNGNPQLGTAHSVGIDSARLWIAPSQRPCSRR